MKSISLVTSSAQFSNCPLRMVRNVSMPVRAILVPAGVLEPRIGRNHCFNVSRRRRPSDSVIAPMVSPPLCPTLSIAFKLKFFPLRMLIAADIGQMMANCALWRKALPATGRRQAAAATARRHGICRSLLTTWRRQYRNGELRSSRPVAASPRSGCDD